MIKATKFINQSHKSKTLTSTVCFITGRQEWIGTLEKSEYLLYGAASIDHGELENQLGHGLIEAPRGALGHWANIKDDKISSYQIITPTAWNASPRDAEGVRGPLEEALIGTRVENPDNPLEVYHVVRSFDPCLVCTVHAIALR